LEKLAKDKHCCSSDKFVANEWTTPALVYLKGEHLKGAPALPAVIKLGWKALPRTNTSAFDGNEEKTFYNNDCWSRPLPAR